MRVKVSHPQNKVRRWRQYFKLFTSRQVTGRHIYTFILIREIP